MNSTEDIVEAITARIGQDPVSVEDRALRAKAVRLVLSEQRLQDLSERASSLRRRGIARTEIGRSQVIARRFLTGQEQALIDSRTFYLALLEGRRPTKEDIRALKSSSQIAKLTFAMAAFNLGLGALLIGFGALQVVLSLPGRSSGGLLTGVAIAMIGIFLGIVGGIQIGKAREKMRFESQLAAIAEAVSEGAPLPVSSTIWACQDRAGPPPPRRRGVSNPRQKAVIWHSNPVARHPRRTSSIRAAEVIPRFSASRRT